MTTLAMNLMSLDTQNFPHDRTRQRISDYVERAARRLPHAPRG